MRDPEMERMRQELKRLEDDPFRRRRSLYTDSWFFEWLPYMLVAFFIVGGLALLSWVGAMRDDDCKAKGGTHRRHVGRYAPALCLTDDGRIIE